MLKELLKNREFLKIINNYLKENEIIDILLFGSAVRGKESPEDIDFIIIYNESIKDITEKNYKIRKDIEKFLKNPEITGIKYSKLFKTEFLAREAVISEAFSFRANKFIAEGLGYKNFILFKYSLKNFNKSKRMQFYYSLYGRGKEKGILKKTGSYKFSDSIIFSDINNSETIKKFLEKWNIEFITFPILFPARIASYLLQHEQ